MINLVKSFKSFDSLTYCDRLVVFLTIDASNSALSMALCDKECLAARSYVATCHTLQASSFVVKIVALVLSGQGWASNSECCDKQIWWSLLSSCAHPGWSLWLYILLRLLLWADIAHMSRVCSSWFDNWKKGGRLADEGITFEAIPSTVFDRFSLELPLLLVNVCSLLVALKR